MHSRDRRIVRRATRGVALAAAVACAGASVAGCAGDSPESAAPASSAVVYDGATLIDGTGLPATEAARLVVDQGAVVAVGPQAEIEMPSGATVVDLSDKTVMPALVNLHGHVGFQRGLTYDAANYTRENVVDHLNRYAYYGVGVIVSLGTDAGDVWSGIRRDQEAGNLGGARLFTAGRGLARPNAGPGAAALRPSAYGVTSEEEGRGHVQELAALGVSFVKIWVDDRGGSVEKLDPPLYRAIIDEAHRHDLAVIAHVFYHDDAEELVAAGVDGFAHLVRDREMDDALVAAIVDRDVFVMRTSASRSGAGIRNPRRGSARPFLQKTVGPPRDVLRVPADRSRARTRTPGRGAAPSADGTQELREKLPTAPSASLSSDRTRGGRKVTSHACRRTGSWTVVAAGLRAHGRHRGRRTSRSADRLGLDDSGRLTAGAPPDFSARRQPVDATNTNTRGLLAEVYRWVGVDRAALRAGWGAP